jgi:hypothetical protein
MATIKPTSAWYGNANPQNEYTREQNHYPQMIQGEGEQPRVRTARIANNWRERSIRCGKRSQAEWHGTAVSRTEHGSGTAGTGQPTIQRTTNGEHAQTLAVKVEWPGGAAGSRALYAGRRW